jgi:hypothetical protein
MTDPFLDGNIFGLIDNIILIIGSFTGLAAEKFLPFKTVGIGAVIGAGIGNAVSDLLGGLAIDPIFGLGTFVGCLAALIIIPAFTAAQQTE